MVGCDRMSVSGLSYSSLIQLGASKIQQILFPLNELVSIGATDVLEHPLLSGSKPCMK